MKSMLRGVKAHDVSYQCLMFVCPGCKLVHPHDSGLHMLPVNCSIVHSPSWDFDGNLELPTLSSSIMTGRDSPNVCHSFLKAGVFQFLNDCTHKLAGQFVPIPDLPDWVVNEE